MPNNRVAQTLYIGAGASIETLNTTTLYRPGELGSRIDVGGKSYQLIQLDSGATASSGAGLPLSGQQAFWKDRSRYLVTNDKVQAIGGPSTTLTLNAFAGTFNSVSQGASGTASITPGNYGVIQQRGQHSGVATDGGADFVVNDMIVPKAGATAVGDRTAQGTAPPVNVIGRVTAVEGAVTASYTPAYLGGWEVVEVD